MHMNRVSLKNGEKPRPPCLVLTQAQCPTYWKRQAKTVCEVQSPATRGASSGVPLKRLKRILQEKQRLLGPSDHCVSHCTGR